MEILKDVGVFGLIAAIVAYAVKVYWDAYVLRRQFVSAALTECLQMFHGLVIRLSHPQVLTAAGVSHTAGMPGPYLMTADVVRNIPDQVIHHGMLQVRACHDALDRVESRLREKELVDSARDTLLFERAALMCELTFALARTAELLCDKERTHLELGGHEQMLKFVGDLHRLSVHGIHDIVEALRPTVRHLAAQAPDRWQTPEDLTELQKVLQGALAKVTEVRDSQGRAFGVRSHVG